MNYSEKNTPAKKDTYERLTQEEMTLLEKVDDRNNVSNKTFFEALDLLDHLEEQKEKLENREQIEQKGRFSEKIADTIAALSGNVFFVVIHLLWFGFWIYANTGHTVFGLSNFDPFPYGLLTMIVSLEAIFLSTFILISQNRQGAHDRSRDEIDFERDRLDLKVDTLAARTIREATIKIGRIEGELGKMNAKLDKIIGKKK